MTVIKESGGGASLSALPIRELGDLLPRETLFKYIQHKLLIGVPLTYGNEVDIRLQPHPHSMGFCYAHDTSPLSLGRKFPSVPLPLHPGSSRRDVNLDSSTFYITLQMAGLSLTFLCQ